MANGSPTLTQQIGLVAPQVRLEATGELVRASNVLIATGNWPHPGGPIPGIERGLLQ